MPQINISVTPEEHQKLLNAHQKAVDASQSEVLPPTFDEWMVAAVFNNAGTEASLSELNKIRSFDGIEKLVTSLHKHGFGLAYYSKSGAEPTMSAALLAHTLVQGLKLAPSYVKRLQNLFVHYQKDARDIADAAQVGVTNRAYGAVSEAFTQLVARTEKAVDNLGEERAIGRVEGGIAILVGVDVMTRAAANKKTAEFKTKLRNPTTIKGTWVDKVFRGSDGKK